jgi:hypothetical protein
MDLKLMVFTKSTRSKRICDSNGAPYFADQRPEMFVLLIKIKMEQSMIKTKYIWAILDFELGIQLNFEFKGVYVNTTLAENSVCKLCNRIAFADSPRQNYTSDVFNRWYGEGTSGPRLPRLASHPQNHGLIVRRMIEAAQNGQ